MSAATTRTGLSLAEAKARLDHDGPNRLPVAPPPSPWLQLLAQMTHFFAIMLWVAAALALVARMPQLAAAISVIVVINGLFAFVQEFRADWAAQRLRDLLPARAMVVRDGHRHEIDAEELVVGDLVLLEGGDRVCADLDLDTSVALAVDESMLTGESVPAHPDEGGRLNAGTFVVEGEASGLVVAVGADTRLGEIATLMRRVKPPPSPLTTRLNRVVRITAVVAITVGVAFFGLALLLGSPPSEGFLFAIGVTVALVPEGLLPTVTLSLAHAAGKMADQHALVRRLESVESLGSTTYICSDKTGTLTQNQMAVLAVWTPTGEVRIEGQGYDPTGTVTGSDEARSAAADLALAALGCSTGHVRRKDDVWGPIGDPMEVALHVLAWRLCGADPAPGLIPTITRRIPFDPRRRRTSAVVGNRLALKGAPEVVLPLCADTPGAETALQQLAERGLRVLAVAGRDIDPDTAATADTVDLERDLTLLGLVGIEDPPRDGVQEAIRACRAAGIRLAMLTGDHPATAAAVADQVGLTEIGAIVVDGLHLPDDDAELGLLLDRDGVVVARVAPEQKLRIARALRARGHVVAMTGDGVNDGPALREADVGIAMGKSGTDVAREAADLVLLDDHFATIVTAVALGRATFFNIRRFLTYHLTDNVAELTPFVVWALTGSSIPLAIGVLQVLALDIGTDLLPALALGAEPPSARVLAQRPPTGQLLDRSLLVRAFGVLGPTEAVMEMAAFLTVLVAGGWSYGDTPSTALLALASGTAFASVVLAQMANAFGCRSAIRPAWRVPMQTNPLLLAAVATELGTLVVFLTVPPLSHYLGGSWPSLLGWGTALLAVPAVLLADATAKAFARRRQGQLISRVARTGSAASS